MTKGGKRIGAGRPRIHRSIKFILDRNINILPKNNEDYSLLHWLSAEDPFLCWLCDHFHKVNDDCKSLKCELSPSDLGNSNRMIYFWNKKNFKLYTFCKVLLGKLPFCAICKSNRPTKKVLYRCEHQEKCDVFPKDKKEVSAPLSPEPIITA